MNGQPTASAPVNEPVLDYAPGDPERAELQAELAAQASDVVEIPLVIGGERVRTGDTFDVVMPHAHGHVLARAHRAGEAEVEGAIRAALEAQGKWAARPWEERVGVFLRAAELLAGPRRQKLNAATMLGQSKSVLQAEIDSACEAIDFFRFGAHFARRIHEMQPISKHPVRNRSDYRPLEGFVYAVSPFNFTAIGANLSGTPAMMGNTVVWKPASSAVLSNYYLLEVFEEAGLPPGVVNFLMGDAVRITDTVTASPHLAGIHFTGSTGVFRGFWKTVGERIDTYRTYPRLVGETGGKNFIVAHPTADLDALRTAIVRGGFEYQGQKCSASSRVYVPRSVWEKLREPLVEETAGLRMGDPRDFTNFVNAVIDRKAFEKITGYIEEARASADAEILVGGDADDSEGFFVRPTIIRTTSPDHATMCDEIFGPVVTVYVYDDADWSGTLDLVDGTSPYALTGAVFAEDPEALDEATRVLRQAAGNFYVNDKPTGAVVGQQPFGGARASGTNDKAGSMLNPLRWVSPRSIKENLEPPTDYRYPFMEPD